MRKTSIARRRKFGPSSMASAGSIVAAIAVIAGCGGDDTAVGGPGGPDGSVDVTTVPPADTGAPVPDSGQDSTTTQPDSSTTPDAGDSGAPPCDDNGGALATVFRVAAGTASTFMLPLDAVPDTAGANVYFTGVAVTDGTGGVFSAGVSGGAVSTLASGLGLPSGIALSDDGKTLFIADSASPIAPSDFGAIVTLGVGGGTPVILGGTDGYQPRDLVISGADVYFSGVDPSNGKPGVFSVGENGGTPSIIAEGSPFGDPEGVAVSASGTVYVTDATAAGGAVFTITSGAVATLRRGVSVGFPAGLTLSANGGTLVASSLARGGGQLLLLDLSGAADAGVPPTVAPGTVATSTEPAGLHRAHAGCAYAFVDSAANGLGTVYLLSK